MMSENESKSLTWIRTFAMLSIMVCHLFQAYHNVWADVFNMCGPFLMAYVTPYIGLNVVLMFVSIAIAIFFFVKLMGFMNIILEKKDEKYIVVMND